MMTILIGLAAAASASTLPVTALWGEVTYGMPVQQARSLYPAGAKVRHQKDRIVIKDHVVSEQCKADVNIHPPAGSVERVVVRGDASLAGRCSAAVLAGLAKRYGPPSNQYQLDVTPLAREKTTYVWTQDGMTLRFKRYTNGGLGGGGLGGASWELSYSTREDDVNI